MCKNAKKWPTKGESLDFEAFLNEQTKIFRKNIPSVKGMNLFSLFFFSLMFLLFFVNNMKNTSKY